MYTGVRGKDLCAILLFCALLHVQEASVAEFLGIHERFTNSNYYDSYYCCNACGGVLQWVVDGEASAIYRTTENEVGSVDVTSGAHVSYTSMILSMRPNGSDTCMDAVLIATQTDSEWRPQVICRSSVELTVQYDDNEMTIPQQVDIDTVTLSHPISQLNIVSPKKNCTTQILVCSSGDGLLTWTGNGSSVAVFGAADSVGDYEYILHPSDPTIAMWETFILEKTSDEITSVIVWTDYESVGTFDITCHSGTHTASITVNSPSSTVSPAPSSSSESTTTFPTRASAPTDQLLEVASVASNVSLIPSSHGHTTVVIIVVPLIVVVFIIIISSIIIISISRCYKRLLKQRRIKGEENDIDKDSDVWPQANMKGGECLERGRAENAYREV